MAGSENPMRIKELLECSNDVLDISYQIEKEVSKKINNKKAITPNVLQDELKKFSKQNITCAQRVVDAVSKFINLIKIYFTGKVLDKSYEKKQMLFRQITGLSKNDVKDLDDLHFKIRENAMNLKGKTKWLK